MLSNQEIIARVRAWQKAKHVHPLTCGNNSIHRPLVAVEKASGQVVLECSDCRYTQTNIPEIVLAGVPPNPLAGFKQ